MTTATLNPSPIQFGWDRRNRKEIENAKTKYRQAKAEGRIVVDEHDKEVESFSPDLEFLLIKEEFFPEDCFAVRILDETGDRRIIWNSGNPNQIAEAKQKFKEYLAKGCRIYAIDRRGRKGKRVIAFDDALEEIIVEEDRKTIKQAFVDFVKQFRHIEVLPKTMPG